MLSSLPWREWHSTYCLLGLICKKTRSETTDSGTRSGPCSGAGMIAYNLTVSHLTRPKRDSRHGYPSTLCSASLIRRSSTLSEREPRSTLTRFVFPYH